ncbi:DUF742 domain-containing protein [Streptomyces sp. NPDC048290]|uniref:DUF742 domain-containing protein n=1 Tax=Streptomyces sp. NPDC048290 TaxID=3155811 RepID=UPI003449AEFB
MTRRPEGRRMVPAYLAVGGRAVLSRNTLQGLTALSVTGLRPGPQQPPAHQRMMGLLEGGSLSVAETAAYLNLPVGACKVIASELVDGGHLTAHRPGPLFPPGDGGPAQVTTGILERLVSGLQALK